MSSRPSLGAQVLAVFSFTSSVQKMSGLSGPIATELLSQEDVNGEKLTVKKWWIFGADFFTVWFRFFHGLRRFFTVGKGHER